MSIPTMVAITELGLLVFRAGFLKDLKVFQNSSVGGVGGVDCYIQIFLLQNKIHELVHIVSNDNLSFLLLLLLSISWTRHPSPTKQTTTKMVRATAMAAPAITSTLFQGSRQNNICTDQLMQGMLTLMLNYKYLKQDQYYKHLVTVLGLNSLTQLT